MFRKILIAAMFATAAGYCFAAETVPQVVTSQVSYQNNPVATVDNGTANYANQNVVPTWPIAGSDADVDVSCSNGAAGCGNVKNSDNIKIVSKIGSDLVVENNFSTDTRGASNSWSGGANMLHGNQLPAGFDDECNTQSEMPLMNREMLEDDGGQVLTVSRSSRSKCSQSSNSAVVSDYDNTSASENEIAVDQSADAEAPKELKDQVRSWVVASGQTLRDVLQTWCDKEGWDFVWATSREYPIEASAVFKGRFVDVASALVRNFSRANPIPYAKFYKGNRVLVVSTNEE